jgi:hypothetical protein
MKHTPGVLTIQQLIELTISRKIHPNPIGQRPPVASTFKKSEEIVKSLLDGYGIGLITLRDIRDDEEARKVYPGYDYLVIDGGHRIRSLRDFFNGKFTVNGKTFNQMDDLNLSDLVAQICYCVCTAKEATSTFRAINTTTPVNFMEMVMSDDVSRICREIRTRTSYVVEYDNVPKAVFEIETDQKGNVKTKCFSEDMPNPRRKWDEYVAIAMIKTMGGGNVDAGQTEIEVLVENDCITKNSLAVVDRFLQDAFLFRKNRSNAGSTKFNSDTFAAFQLVWFGLYERCKTFSISDYTQFTREFMRVYSLLTGNSNTQLDDVMIVFKKEKHILKEFFRKNQKNFSNQLAQRECFEQFMLLTNVEKLGVINRTEKRSLSSSEREEHLAIQGYVCALDAQPLTLEDSVWGHDTPWAKGGSLSAGAVIRNTHNRDMGSMTLDEYRVVLQWRKDKENAA